MIEDRVLELGKQLANKYADKWPLDESGRILFAQNVCRGLYAKYSGRTEWVDKAQLWAAIETRIAKLQEEISRSQRDYLDRLEKRPPMEWYIDNDSGERRQMPTKDISVVVKWVTFKNKVSIDFLKLAFMGDSEYKGQTTGDMEEEETFEGCFKDSNDIKKVLEVLTELKLIDRSGDRKWKGFKYVLVGLVDVLKHKGYLKSSSENTYHVFARYFGTTVSVGIIRGPIQDRVKGIEWQQKLTRKFPIKK